MRKLPDSLWYGRNGFGDRNQKTGHLRAEEEVIGRGRRELFLGDVAEAFWILTGVSEVYAWTTQSRYHKAA